MIEIAIAEYFCDQVQFIDNQLNTPIAIHKKIEMALPSLFSNLKGKS